jgi:UDP-glucuronate 4-epimerase
VRVLVTGGAGFIGGHLVDALRARGDSAVILDNFDPSSGDPARRAAAVAASGVPVVVADIRDEGAVLRALDGVDAVVHLAARAGVRESLSDPLLYESVNLRGTAVLVDALRRAGARPLVFASSSSVYGAGSGVFTEDHPADAPLSPYAATKRGGELLLHAAARGWGQPAVCLRFFTVYGPRQRGTMAIARFTAAALGGPPAPLYGDGSALRDYTEVSDAVSAVLAALAHPAPWGVYNVGSGAPIRLDALIALIGRLAGAPVRTVAAPSQAGDVPSTHAGLARVREGLGWQPQVRLDAGLQRVLDWARAETAR